MSRTALFEAAKQWDVPETRDRLAVPADLARASDADGRTAPRPGAGPNLLAKLAP